MVADKARRGRAVVGWGGGGRGTLWGVAQRQAGSQARAETNPGPRAAGWSSSLSLRFRARFLDQECCVSWGRPKPIFMACEIEGILMSNTSALRSFLKMTRVSTSWRGVRIKKGRSIE
ncbi:hypothetical protein BU14_0745s0004 [Porphyra umbilicalis]|uniref:Uncharacterized protein n=1 Tax=Porphyra umbilicalis TaxID=2786 RepID=A0A1X6NPQ4_PORUM|nr:hypothetical protein BU14_0745s0004 [Porphyra umbilicalis]|eukprot:OSX70476.1 hypothetical protein BU14_0745s0004 [Porphyra umbilicalis]